MNPTFHNENILRLTWVDNFATVFERCPGSFGSFFGRISCWLFRNFPMMSIQTMWQSKDNFPDPNQSHSSWKARFPNYCMSRKLTHVLIDAQYLLGHWTVSPPMVIHALVLSLLHSSSDWMGRHSLHEAQLLQVIGHSQSCNSSSTFDHDELQSHIG